MVYDLISRDDFKANFECVFRGKLDGMTAQDVTRRVRKLIKEARNVPVIPVMWLTDIIDRTCYADKDPEKESDAVLNRAANLIYDLWVSEQAKAEETPELKLGSIGRQL